MSKSVSAESYRCNSGRRTQEEKKKRQTKASPPALSKREGAKKLLSMVCILLIFFLFFAGPLRCSGPLTLLWFASLLRFLTMILHSSLFTLHFAISDGFKLTPFFFHLR